MRFYCMVSMYHNTVQSPHGLDVKQNTVQSPHGLDGLYVEVQ